jgi:uncharacterized protein YjiS (DUF1127 family)
MFAPAAEIAFAAPRLSVASLLATVSLWADRSSQRRTLAALTATELKDIGLDPTAATVEAAKPFWVA